ncbi:interference hedgehog-like isoform X2 [Ischnura elegans]|uniref:interference hedgehog-like isoform X2 n=1 Tax=Ischnura elegans TaxID=197161 RepID=UPI001ED8BF4D|nr:interference hedgehog-like isoform X2 [Ischnura elegans]
MDCREVVAPFSWTFWLVILATAVFADVGLRFSSCPESISVPPGDEVMFECSLNVTAEQVTWKHRGKVLTLDPYTAADDDLGHLEDGSARLYGLDLIVQVSRDPKIYMEQAGDYQCIASFGALRLASNPAQLTIIEIKEFDEKEDENYTVTVGNTVALQCDPPYSMPPAIVEFYHNRTHSKVSKQIVLAPGESSLVLSQVTEQDSGVYSCKATNFVNAVYSRHRIYLNVVRAGQSASELRPPRFLSPPPLNYTAVIGSNVTLQCIPVGHPPPLVKWQKYGGELPKDRVEIIPAGLRLIKVSHGDEGTYLCKASNTAGSIPEVIIQLNIEEPPAIVREPVNTDVEEGGMVELDCVAKGLPAPSISWLFNGESVENDSLIKVEGGKLSVQNVQLRHAGIVQCFATNSLGSVFGSAMLRVSPKQLTAGSNGNFAGTDLGNEEALEDPLLPPTPSSGGRKHGPKKKNKTRKVKGRRKDKKHREAVMVPPSQPIITPLTDESVMVRWKVPENDGLKIQFFKVQYRDLGPGHISGWNTIDDDIPPHIRSYEVRNLKVNNVYRFRIAAVYTNNDNLLGPNSIRFHMQERTFKKPPYPPKLTVTEVISPSAIKIEWEFLDTDTIPIEGFFIYYRATTNAGEYTKASADANTRSYIITHLLPGTSYDIQVKSYSSAGVSESSAILTAKTFESESVPTKEDDDGGNRVPSGGEDVTTPETSFSSNSQLYIFVGAGLLGAVVLIILLSVALYNCRHRLSALQNPPPATEDDVSDGYQMTSGSRELGGLNGNGIGNGHTGNGYLPSQARVNITSNPLSNMEEGEEGEDGVESSIGGKRNCNSPTCSGADIGGHRAQRAAKSNDSEERTPTNSNRNSTGSPSVLHHRNQSNDAACNKERPSSPSWVRNQKSGGSSEDYV